MKEKILFLHGLWLNPNGFLAGEISRNATVVPLLGLSMEWRLQMVHEYLEENPSIDTIVAHSAGCLVATLALEIGLFKDQIKKVILLNPAPLPGIQFTPKDKVWWAIFRYLWQILFGRKVGLTHEHMLSLLSLKPTQLQVLDESFLPDRSEFVRGIVLGQFKFLQRNEKVINRHDVPVTIVHMRDDNMVGQTPVKTVKRFEGAELVQMEGGHLTALLNFRQVVGNLIGK